MSAIVAEGLGKQFRQYHDRGSLLARALRRGGTRDVQDVWALRDVDFTVERGGTLGIIGRNGSGKTTLLRLLSGVSGPSEGHLRIEGRIAPLIGIGVGFNRELTGRENVRVNGRLLGMSPDEVADAFDRIVTFAELEDFIDLPVKFYSSGMFLRLAFSVAIHTDPEVLLVDEILAVGDVGFQAKCFDRMRELQHAGTTIVVVTHNLQVLSRMTHRTLVLDHGRVRFDGPTEEALEVYHQVMQEEAADRADRGPVPPGQLGMADVARVATAIEGDDGADRFQVAGDEGMVVRLEASFVEEVEDPVVAVIIERPGLGRLFVAASRPRGAGNVHGPGRGLTARVRLDRVPLLPGTFSVTGYVLSARNDLVLGQSRPVLFHVDVDALGSGSVAFGPSIEIDGAPAEVWQLERLAREPGEL